MDILDGMSYLHSRNMIHSRLNSSNCLVDQRLTIKITGFVSFSNWIWNSNELRLCFCLDYGLEDLRFSSLSTQSFAQSVEAYKRVYYAPELFSIVELKLTPPIDIYAFGIILNEIATRSEPFGVKINLFLWFFFSKKFSSMFRMMRPNKWWRLDIAQKSHWWPTMLTMNVKKISVRYRRPTRVSSSNAF